MFYSTQVCGRCGNLVDFRFQYVLGFTPQDPSAPVVDPNGSLPRSMRFEVFNEEDTVEAAALAQCPRCGKPTMILFRTERRYLKSIAGNLTQTEPLFGGQSLIAVTEVTPAPPLAHHDPAWPEAIRRPFADAQTMLVQHMSPSIIISTCRTVLDVSVKVLGGQGNSIFERVHDLQSKGVITGPIADWAHDIRRFGADATHDASGTASDAHQFIEFLKTFLNVAFTLPARIKERRTSASEGSGT